MECWTNGLLHQWTLQMDSWTNGQLDQWTKWTVANSLRPTHAFTLIDFQIPVQ